jgi:lipopolysaccharide export system protein LptC
MKTGLARFHPVILMALLAAATFWIERLVQPDDTTPAARSRHIADFSAEGFRLVQMNRDGVADTVLAAERGVHYADDGTTELTAPRLSRQRPGEAAIEVRAQRGLVDRDAETIELTGSVRASRAATAGQPALQLETSALTVSLPDETADTNAPVRITRGDSILEGTGMHADGRGRQIELASGVRATFINPRVGAGTGNGPIR